MRKEAIQYKSPHKVTSSEQTAKPLKDTGCNVCDSVAYKVSGTQLAH